MKRVLAIAGSDPSGGAGIQAGLKTALALGVHGMSAVTCITEQDSRGVASWWPLPMPMVRAQIRAVLADIGADAVTVGMLGTAGLVAAVAEELLDFPGPLVVDPVGASTRGDPLLQPAALPALRERLLSRATVVTPNLAEVAMLTGVEVRRAADLRRAAAAVLELGPRWVLVTGGHLPGDAVDLLSDGTTTLELRAARVANRHAHGTGCTLAAALACRLACGDDVPTAVRRAKDYVTGAIRKGFPLGAGAGPVAHGWALSPGRSSRP